MMLEPTQRVNQSDFLSMDMVQRLIYQTLARLPKDLVEQALNDACRAEVQRNNTDPKRLVRSTLLGNLNQAAMAQIQLEIEKHRKAIAV